MHNVLGHQNSGTCCGILQNINVMKIHDANECGALTRISEKENKTLKDNDNILFDTSKL